MSDLRIEAVEGEDALRDWQYVHNTIIPTHVLSLDDVRERVGRNHLEVAYADGVLVGCSTVRPPQDDETATATVIARVLPGHRGRGFGAAIHERGLERARELGARTVETVAWAANEDGLRFAEKHGYAEFERYLLPGDDVYWIELRRTRGE
ncbi:GNAT family N-acetyltransferase [Streptomyces sp. NPDC008313]|uniref:GNAT family N-acetyltransferase n=1 Tax=Streptomyces sp. NPDC008313 TaxID=3364826 RepID=UPI0036E75941